MSQRFHILEYRDFYDIPRAMVVSDSTGHRMLLDSPFDYILDDYSPDYVVYDIPDEVRIEVGMPWDEQFMLRLRQVGRIRAPAIEFDETRRSSFASAELVNLMKAQ